MYKKVLVPLDGTREAEEIYDRVQSDLAPDCEVLLLQVVTPKETVMVGDHVYLASQREDTERLRSEAYLRSVVKGQGRDPELWSTNVVLSGSVSQAIVEFAKENDVELIAMYTNDRKGLARLFRGNKAREVQRLAAADVRVFKVMDGEVEVLEEVEAPVAAAAVAEPAVEAEAEPETTEALVTSGTLTNVDLFQDLSPYQIDQLASLGELRSVAAGVKLGDAEGSAQELHVIIQGEAELSVMTEVGEIPVRVAESGDSFPLAALLGSGAMITTGRALTPLELLVIPSASLIELCSKDAEIGMRVYRAAAELFAERYSDTLDHLARAAVRELKGSDATERWTFGGPNR
jgi:nucleotide-binding universal stress UspA family protein